MNQEKSKARWEKIVSAYRLNPGNHWAVQELVGCDHRTAKRAWEKGWPRYGFSPIRDTIQEEQHHARAQRALSLDYSLAGKDSIAQRTEEATLAGLARSAAGSLLRSILKLAGPVEELAGDLAKALEQQRADFHQDHSDPKALLGLLQRVTSVTREATSAAREAVELERKILGEPSSVTTVNVLALKGADSPEESDHLDRLLSRVLERRQARVLANGAPTLPTEIIEAEASEQ